MPDIKELERFVQGGGDVSSIPDDVWTSAGLAPELKQKIVVFQRGKGDTASITLQPSAQPAPKPAAAPETSLKDQLIQSFHAGADRYLQLVNDMAKAPPPAYDDPSLANILSDPNLIDKMGKGFISYDKSGSPSVGPGFSPFKTWAIRRFNELMGLGASIVAPPMAVAQMTAEDISGLLTGQGPRLVPVEQQVEPGTGLVPRLGHAMAQTVSLPFTVGGTAAQSAAAFGADQDTQQLVGNVAPLLFFSGAGGGILEKVPGVSKLGNAIESKLPGAKPVKPTYIPPIEIEGFGTSAPGAPLARYNASGVVERSVPEFVETGKGLTQTARTKPAATETRGFDKADQPTTKKGKPIQGFENSDGAKPFVLKLQKDGSYAVEAPAPVEATINASSPNSVPTLPPIKIAAPEDFQVSEPGGTKQLGKRKKGGKVKPTARFNEAEPVSTSGAEAATGGNKPVPTIQPTGSTVALPPEIQAVVDGNAPAWFLPHEAEGTIPTKGEAFVRSLDKPTPPVEPRVRIRGPRTGAADASVGARSKVINIDPTGTSTISPALGAALGPKVRILETREGTIVFNPEIVTAEQIKTLESEGRVADVVNGPRTSPKPEKPTLAVIARDAEGTEVRTILADNEAKAKAAVEYQQAQGLKTEVVPADSPQAVAVLRERLTVPLKAKSQVLSRSRYVDSLGAEEGSKGLFNALKAREESRARAAAPKPPIDPNKATSSDLASAVLRTLQEKDSFYSDSDTLTSLREKARSEGKSAAQVILETAKNGALDDPNVKLLEETIDAETQSVDRPVGNVVKELDLQDNRQNNSGVIGGARAETGMSEREVKTRGTKGGRKTKEVEAKAEARRQLVLDTIRSEYADTPDVVKAVDALKAKAEGSKVVGRKMQPIILQQAWAKLKAAIPDLTLEDVAHALTGVRRSTQVAEKITGEKPAARFTARKKAPKPTSAQLNAMVFGEDVPQVGNREVPPPGGYHSSGLDPTSTHFNAPRRNGYAWRGMSFEELKAISQGETRGGGQTKRGNWFAAAPESAAQFVKPGGFLVEFAGTGGVVSETIPNVVGREHISRIWLRTKEGWKDIKGLDDLKSAGFKQVSEPRKDSSAASGGSVTLGSGLGALQPLLEKGSKAASKLGSDIFDSAITELSKVNTEGKILAQKMAQVIHESARDYHRNVIPLDAAWKALSAEDKATISAMPRQGNQDYRGMSPAAQAYGAAWHDTVNRLENERYKVGNFIQGRGGPRRSHIPAKDFQPVHFDPAIVGKMRNNDPQLLAEFQKLNPGVKTNPFAPTHNPKTGAVYDIARRTLESHELARQFKYPESWLTKNVHESHRLWIEDLTKSNAEHRNYRYNNPDGTPRNAGIGDKADFYHSLPLNERQAWERTIDTIEGHGYKHLTEKQRKLDKVVRGVNLYTTIAKIGGNIVSGLKQPTSLLNISTVTDFPTLAKGLVDMMLSPVEARRKAVANGAAPFANEFPEYFGSSLGDQAGHIAKTASRLSTAFTGFMDGLTRSVAHEAAPHAMKLLQERIREGGKAKEATLRLLDDMLFKPEEIAEIGSGKVSPATELKFKNSFVSYTQQSARMAERPRWTHEGYGKMVAHLRQFGLGQTRFHIQNVVKEAKTHGNYGPLRRAIIGAFVAGELVREAVSPFKADDEERKDWSKMKSADEVIYRTTQDMSDAAFLGLLGDAGTKTIHGIITGKMPYKGDPASNNVVPVFLDSFSNYYVAAVKMLNDPKLKHILSLLDKEFAAKRQFSELQKSGKNVDFKAVNDFFFAKPPKSQKPVLNLKPR